MNVVALTWFLIASCVTYAVAVDENVLTWLALQSKVVTIWLRKKWFSIRYNPDSPSLRWKIDRNANENTKKLRKEYEITEKSNDY
jgi:hypothetical protein